jgi:hypothetical protein
VTSSTWPAHVSTLIAEVLAEPRRRFRCLQRSGLCCLARRAQAGEGTLREHGDERVVSRGRVPGPLEAGHPSASPLPSVS